MTMGDRIQATRKPEKAGLAPDTAPAPAVDPGLPSQVSPSVAAPHIEQDALVDAPGS